MRLIIKNSTKKSRNLRGKIYHMQLQICELEKPARGTGGKGEREFNGKLYQCTRYYKSIGGVSMQ